MFCENDLSRSLTGSGKLSLCVHLMFRRFAGSWHEVMLM